MKQKVIFTLVLFISIISTGVFLASSAIVEIIYLVNEDKYKSDIFNVERVYYLDNSRPNIQRWDICGRIGSNSEERVISAADIIDVSDVKSNAELEEAMAFIKSIDIKYWEGCEFNVSGRDIGVLPQSLSSKMSNKSIWLKVFYFNFPWLFVVYLCFPPKKIRKPLSKRIKGQT